MIGTFEAILFFVLLYGLSLFAAFWLIRLAVRYGTEDALRRNREWLERR